MQEGSLFSTPFPGFIVCKLFDDGHSNQCEVISHCSFDLRSLVMSDIEHLFMLYVFFGEMSILVFLPLFDWVVCFSGIEFYELLVYFGN